MRRLGWVIIGVVGLSAPAGVVFATHALVDTLGRDFGALAANSVGFLQPKPVVAAEPEALAPSSPAPAAEPVVTESLSAPTKNSRRGPVKARAPAALGVRISARQVLELARRGAIPQAVPVTAEGPRPAGLRLSGVAGLGVGMKDGDVLTRVAGVPATSVGAVADLVIRARARLAPEISAEFWRDGAHGVLVVEQPYVTANSRTVPTSMSSASSSTNAAEP